MQVDADLQAPVLEQTIGEKKIEMVPYLNLGIKEAEQDIQLPLN